MTEAVVRTVKRFAPDRIVLLPLYPQFSTATTKSSVEGLEGREAAKLNVPTQIVCCYPDDPGFIAASVDLVKQGSCRRGDGPVRVLFSAHGLPEKDHQARRSLPGAGRANGRRRLPINSAASTGRSATRAGSAR